MHLLLVYGDGVINVIHKVVIKQQVTLISVEKETGIMQGIGNLIKVAVIVAAKH